MNHRGLVFWVSRMFMTVTHNGKWNVWSQRWPIMTESFLVRFVWARPKNWRSPRAATWKSDFTASSGIGKFSLMCIPISCPLLEFLLGSFMSCHCIFKTACLKKSQCVTSRVTGERKVAECGRWKRVCVCWRGPYCGERFEKKTKPFCMRPNKVTRNGLMVRPSPLHPLSPCTPPPC